VDEKGQLRARGTTLGGDDGVAVAVMMAAADGMIPSHPTLECLFTVSEEVGLDGANGFDYSRISSRILLNMDSEEEDAVIVGCAGGVRSDLLLPIASETNGERFDCAMEIRVKGLKGGHSGEDINKGRANANKLIGRLLSAASAVAELRLASIVGGSKDNAIPRECTAVVALSMADADKVTAILRGDAAKLPRHFVRMTAALSGRSL
jgi:dipeptidase D